MTRTSMYRVSSIIALGALVFASACGQEAKTPDDQGSVPKAEGGAPSVTPTGQVITIEAYSDSVGNYFKPNAIDAHRGDIVRFVLKSGVHNVHFLADSAVPPALPDR